MKRLPEHFTEAGDSVMSNFDHEIRTEVAEEIKGKDLFASYPGWNFYGRCWWDGQWNCEVWTHHDYRETFSEDTLEEIMSEVSDKYGYE